MSGSAARPSGMVQKYTHDGSKLLLQLGKKGMFDSSDGTAKGKPLNSNAAAFYMPSSIFVDRTNGDVYVSDGEGAGRQSPHCRDGQDRHVPAPMAARGYERGALHDDGEGRPRLRLQSHRIEIQVYDKMGSLKRTIDVPWTPVTPPKDGKLTQSGGSAVAIDFSPDQRLMFVINQNNSEVDVIDRQSGQKVTSFGRPGASRVSSISRTALPSIRRAMSTLPRTAASGFTSFGLSRNARDPLPHGSSLSNGGQQ